jgi:lysylphosphatidylglycerol synthetase-like protein (DUF2156 family)
MNQAWSLGRRVEPTSLTALVALGDLLAIATFVVAGELSHGYTLPEHAWRFVGTFVPFALSWVLVAVVGTLYTREAVANLRTSVGRTLLAWGLAVVIAQALRSTSVFPGGAAVTFALVSFAVGGALLVAWRALVSVVS